MCIALTNSAILDHCAKTGLPVEDLFCRAAKGLRCPHAPRYDSARYQLCAGTEVVLQYHRHAENQMAILEALEDAGWPHRLDNVFQMHMPWDARHRLSDAVTELNHQQDPKRIHFWVERGTQAVLWELTNEDFDPQPGPVSPHSE